MKILSILLSLAVSEKIECYQCTYLWYEVDGVSHGVTGDSTCRDGQADRITLKTGFVSELTLKSFDR